MLASFAELVRVVQRLRGPGGCPWDREQTHRSLRPFVIEEAYEVVDAINSGNAAAIREELGDLLLQVVLHSVIAEETGDFRLSQVIEGITEKIIRRHPHVFEAGDSGIDSNQVRQNWDAIKRQEKGDAPSLLSTVGGHFPALAEAAKLQSKAATVGFDWSQAKEAWPKVEEELGEFQKAWDSGNKDEMEKELGDVLFALTNVARLLGLDPEIALKDTNSKFRRRFASMEGKAKLEDRVLGDYSLEELDMFWAEAKREEVEKKS